MSEDAQQHPWGVPSDAPPPRKRTSWGSDPSAAPAARGADPAAETAAAAAPEAPTGPPAWMPAPGEDVDLAGLHAGTVEALDPFAGPAPDPVGDHSPAASPFADAPGTRPGAESGADVEDVTAAVFTAGASPAVEEPPTADEAATGTGAVDSDALLPDLFAAPVPAVADPQTGDVFAGLFDDEDLPEEVGDRNVPARVEPESAAPATRYESTSEAMTAWHTMRDAAIAKAAAQQPAAAPVGSQEWATEQELANRYASTQRLSETVDRILGLAQSGNARLQGVINGFKLTRDHALDAQQRATYEQVMVPAMNENLITVANPMDFKTVLDIAYDEIIGVGPLGPLWRDDSVTEILVSGPEKVVVERDGALVHTPARFRDLEHLRKTARDLAARVDDRTVSRSIPLVTAQLPGARVQFAVAPVAPVAGVSITIRKFRPLFGIDDLLKFGALTDDMAAFLSDCVAARATILVSGGTGSGKTTMINALSAFIPDSERVITIEDALELSLTNTHVESLLTKEMASGDDTIVIGQDELLRATLRMRPDRIIVGEIRDGSGCATMLQAANTGHDGTMTTVHANNPDRALRRLATLLRTTSDNMGDEIAAEEVRMAFDVVVQVVRVRGRRFVSAISLVNKDGGGTTPVFTGVFGRGDSAPVFRRVGSVGSDTDMAQRFSDAGMDPELWG